MQKKSLQILISLFRKIDLYLLTHYPVLWSVKIHYTILIGGAFSLITGLIAFFFPISISSNLPQTEFFLGAICIYILVSIFYWVYLQSLFSLDKNYGFKSRFYEYYHTYIFFIAIIILFSPMSSIIIMDFRISSLVDDEQRLKIENNYRGNIFVKSDSRIRSSYELLYQFIDNDNELNANINVEYFNVLYDLNKVYGDRKLYNSPHDLEQSYTLGIDKKNNEFLNYITVFKHNLYRLENAIDRIKSLTSNITATLIFIMCLSSVLIVFTSTFQYFGLGLVRLGILVSCLGVAVFGGVFTFIFETFYISGNELFDLGSLITYTTLSILVFQQWWIHYKLKNLKSKSKFYIILGQYLIPLMPLTVLISIIFLDEKNFFTIQYIKKLPKIILPLLIVSLYSFLYIPHIKKVFYKLYLLPQKN